MSQSDSDERDSNFFHFLSIINVPPPEAKSDRECRIGRLLQTKSSHYGPLDVATVYDIDKIVKWLHSFGVPKVEALNRTEQEFVESLRKSLRQGSTKFDWIRLVHLTDVAIQSLNVGKRREEKLVGALARGLSVRQKMAAAEGGHISADEAALQLGMTKQSVLNLYHASKALAWRTEKQGALRFPVWQFLEGRRLPGLELVLTKLSTGGLDDWGKIGFFLQPHGLLEDRRPLDFLREDNLEPVLKAAEAYVE